MTVSHMSKDTGRMNRARTLVCFATVGLIGAGRLRPAAGAAGRHAAVRGHAACRRARRSAGRTGAARRQAARRCRPRRFTYSPEGRRDPFVSLIGSGIDPRFSGARPTGVPGLLINEIGIKGIFKDRAGFAALIQGPDNKTYVIKAGDRLMDGTVKSIVQDAVVFSQDVNDPLSLVKQKEIRKTLRTADGGRG